MKTKDRRFLRLFFSTILLILFCSYVICGIWLAHDIDNHLSYEMHLWVVTNFARFVPYLALFLFSLFAGKSSYINDRLYMVALFAILTAQYFIMEGQYEGILFAPIYEFCDALNMVSFVTTVIMWSRIVMLCIIPMSGKLLLKIYAAVMVLFHVCVYFFSASNGSFNFEHTPILIAEIIFYAGVYNFSELLMDENESVIYNKVINLIATPIIKACWPELLEESDDEFDMYQDLEKITNEKDDYDVDLSYQRMLAAVLYYRNKDVLIAAELVRKLGQKQFFDENGELFSNDYIFEQFTVIHKYLENMNIERPGKISERLLRYLETTLKDRDEPEFLLEAAYLASLMQGTGTVAWDTAVIGNYDTSEDVKNSNEDIVGVE